MGDVEETDFEEGVAEGGEEGGFGGGGVGEGEVEDGDLGEGHPGGIGMCRLFPLWVKKGTVDIEDELKSTIPKPEDEDTDGEEHAISLLEQDVNNAGIMDVYLMI